MGSCCSFHILKKKRERLWMEKKMRSALQPLNMYTSAGFPLQRREKWPVELGDLRSTGAVSANMRGQMISRKTNTFRCVFILGTLLISCIFWRNTKIYLTWVLSWFLYTWKNNAYSFLSTYIILNVRVSSSLIHNYFNRIKWESRKVDCSIT